MAKPTESKPRELEVGKEIEHYLHFVEAQAKKQNIQIVPQIEKDLPRLFCDPAELRQVLINLVLNGMQAMPEGGPVTIRASLFAPRDDDVTPGKKKVLIEVEDKGVGIAANLSEKVFEPFFTAKAEQEAINKALSESDGNREKAADLLGIARKTVYRKLKQYGIE